MACTCCASPKVVFVLPFHITSSCGLVVCVAGLRQLCHVTDLLTEPLGCLVVVLWILNLFQGGDCECSTSLNLFC